MFPGNHDVFLATGKAHQRYVDELRNRSRIIELPKAIETNLSQADLQTEQHGVTNEYH